MALAGQPADDAATLAFGPEFPLDSCECLSDAEVTTILDTHLRSSAAADRPFPRKALEYARRNVGARPLEAVKTEAVHVRQALQDLDFEGTDAGALHVFEVAAITNLMGRDSEPEEARALVPSLRRYDDDQLGRILAAAAGARRPRATFTMAAGYQAARLSVSHHEAGGDLAAITGAGGLVTTPSGVARAFRLAPSRIERAVEGGSGPRVRSLDLLDVRGLDLPEMLPLAAVLQLEAPDELVARLLADELDEHDVARAPGGDDHLGRERGVEDSSEGAALHEVAQLLDDPAPVLGDALHDGADAGRHLQLDRRNPVAGRRHGRERRRLDARRLRRERNRRRSHGEARRHA